MNHTLLFLLLIFFMVPPAFAQETLRIGDTVEYKCTCFGPFEWVKAKVEAVNGNKVRVRYGGGKYQVDTVTNEPETVRSPGRAAQTSNQNQLRDAFSKDAGNKYMQTVRYFAPIYDAKYISGGAPTTPAGWEKAMSELAELDGLCRGKYTGVTNDLSNYLREGIVDNRYAVWCEIAARRNELEKPARMAAAKYMIFLPTKDKLKFAFNDSKNMVPDEAQMLMYDRAKWRQEQSAKLKPRFAEYGIEMPADFFVPVEKRADELIKLIEETAPNRAWEQPAFRDAAVETFVKGKFAVEYPGMKILKSGVGYNTWVERKSLSYVGSDSVYRYYKVEYNSYKRGWVLMKSPNQPFCQASEWVVGRGAKGMVVVSLGGGGIFVKCS